MANVRRTDDANAMIRTLEISAVVVAQSDVRLSTAADIKAAFLKGLHRLPNGYIYSVTEDWIPDDAVISIEAEENPNLRTYLWRVMSDEFTDDDSPHLTPLCLLTTAPTP